MKKKFQSLKIGTFFTALLCLAVAFAFWFFVKYAEIRAVPSGEVQTTSVIYER